MRTALTRPLVLRWLALLLFCFNGHLPSRRQASQTAPVNFQSIARSAAAPRGGGHGRRVECIGNDKFPCRVEVPRCELAHAENPPPATCSAATQSGGGGMWGTSGRMRNIKCRGRGNTPSDRLSRRRPTRIQWCGADPFHCPMLSHGKKVCHVHSCAEPFCTALHLAFLNRHLPSTCPRIFVPLAFSVPPSAISLPSSFQSLEFHLHLTTRTACRTWLTKPR